MKKKSYGALKIPKLAYFFFNSSKFFPFFKLTTRKIFDSKEIFFLFYVAKSISFEVIGIQISDFVRTRAP